MAFRGTPALADRSDRTEFLLCERRSPLNFFWAFYPRRCLWGLISPLHSHVGQAGPMRLSNLRGFRGANLSFTRVTHILSWPIASEATRAWRIASVTNQIIVCYGLLGSFVPPVFKVIPSLLGFFPSMRSGTMCAEAHIRGFCVCVFSLSMNKSRGFFPVDLCGVC